MGKYVYLVYVTDLGINYEDHYKHVDSVWSDKESAVSRIEDGLGMSVIKNKHWWKPSGELWGKEIPIIPPREEFEDDDEWKYYTFTDDGTYCEIQYYEAYIVKYPLDWAEKSE